MRYENKSIELLSIVIKRTIILFGFTFFMTCNPPPSEGPSTFPDIAFSKVIAYQLKGLNEDLLTKDGTLSKNVIGDGFILSREEVNNLLDILNDETSFDDELGLRCFRPHLGFVFYTKANQPVADLSVCFECNRVHSFPNIPNYAFSKKGFIRMEALEKKILTK